MRNYNSNKEETHTFSTTRFVVKYLPKNGGAERAEMKTNGLGLPFVGCDSRIERGKRAFREILSMDCSFKYCSGPTDSIFANS